MANRTVLIRTDEFTMNSIERLFTALLNGALASPKTADGVIKRAACQQLLKDYQASMMTAPDLLHLRRDP